MTRRGAACSGLLLVCTASLGCFSQPEPLGTASPAPATPAIELRGRLAEPPDAELLAAARELLAGGGRRESCGPYALYTDVANHELVAICVRLAARLDEVYEASYGLRPRGEPGSAIVLFSDVAAYRAFARRSSVPRGYAGYALAARGLAVFHAEQSSLDLFATTLAHELVHLVNRRALGVNLPPWLAEGLADGVGDTATPEGFRPLAEDGLGHEALARRLREARASGRAGDLERLVGLKRGEFDRGIAAFDYEHSALFVRFLVSDPDLGVGFRGFLSDFARATAGDSQALAAALGTGWADLDRRFGEWLESV